MPMLRLRSVFSVRATAEGWKPSSAMALRTRALVRGATRRVALRTWETVVTDTPAACATSLIVTAVRPAPRLPL